MDHALKEWLRTPCNFDETSALPWNPSIRYVPIDVVKRKIAFMEVEFDTIVHYYDMNVSAIYQSHSKDTFFTGTIRIEILKKDETGSYFLFKSLPGAATFSTGQYSQNYQYAAIAKSLAIVNAFNSEYNQFGKLLNKEDVVCDMTGIKPQLKKNSDKVMQTIKNIT